MCKELNIEDVIGLLVNPSQENQVTEQIKKSVESGLKKKGYEYKHDKILEIKKEEPKFKVDDWVIDKQGIVHQIANVVENMTDHTYGYDIVGGGYFNDNTEGVRLWTIQDAKNGDILTTDYVIFILESNYGYLSTHCCYSLMSEIFGISNTLEVLPNNVHPATKEQRELLFVKLKECGYYWDEEDKSIKIATKQPISPKFKSGDKITSKYMPEIKYEINMVGVLNTKNEPQYIVRDLVKGAILSLRVEIVDSWGVLLEEDEKSIQYNGNEIILVEVVDNEEAESYSRAFSNIKDAVEFFKNEFLKRFQDPCVPFTDEDIERFINDGYFADEYHSSLIIKNIPFNVKD